MLCLLQVVMLFNRGQKKETIVSSPSQLSTKITEGEEADCCLLVISNFNTFNREKKSVLPRLNYIHLSTGTPKKMENLLISHDRF